MDVFEWGHGYVKAQVNDAECGGAEEVGVERLSFVTESGNIRSADVDDVKRSLLITQQAFACIELLKTHAWRAGAKPGGSHGSLQQDCLVRP
jgi:hypothetical protein